MNDKLEMVNLIKYFRNGILLLGILVEHHQVFKTFMEWIVT